MDAHDALLAERLNSEPVIFRGCTSSELGLIAALAVAFWLPVSFTVAGLLGAFTLGMGSAALGVLATVALTASVLQRIKRGRPAGYHRQRLMLALHDAGLHRAPVVRRSGPWDIGRHTP
jgi:conjugative transfer region protein (TIGR03750 family)